MDEEIVPTYNLTTHGHHLEYDDHSKPGFSYLHTRLNAAEAKVFFDQARLRGHAQFEDHHGHRYELRHGAGKFSLHKI